MPRFITYILLLFVAFSCSISVNAQLSLNEMIKYGDNAYDQKNYASAIHFYMMVVDESQKIERISSYPYAFDIYNDESSASVDSLSNDSIQAIEDVTDPEQSAVDPSEIYATHRIAESCRLMNDYDLSRYWYIQSLQMQWSQRVPDFPLDRFWYANTLINLAKYKEAEEELKTFVIDNEGIGENMKYYLMRAKQLITNCRFAQSSRSKKPGVSVTKGDSLLNNGSTSFAVSFYDHEQIVLSSARNTSTEDGLKKIESNFLSDLFFMRGSEGKYEGAQTVGGDLNSKHHEGAPSVGDNKSIMYFTRWYSDNDKKPAVHASNYFVDKWMKPRKLGDAVNKKGYSSMHPYITKDNKLLFFSSDMPGGQGGFDIWVCKIDRRGFASDPLNLGPSINSPEDEITPFYHEATNVLYFSSTGHENMGGFDVFKVTYNRQNNYAGRAENMGFPINSPKNDKYFVLDDLQLNGFLTSNRDRCSDCETSYCNSIYNVQKEENKFMLSGYVFDAMTDEIIPNAKITVKDVLGVFEDYSFEADDEGYYELPLSPEMHIFIKAQQVEYFAYADHLSTIGIDKSQDFTIDFWLTKFPYEEIALPGILYDYDKASLRPESMVVLDSLIEFLNINDNLIIEISSHTDEHGAEAYNNKLSQKRAESVVNYLIENEIHPDRLLAKGYGKSKPLIPNAKTEEEDQQNRRTSFRILGENFEPVTKIIKKP